MTRGQRNRKLRNKRQKCNCDGWPFWHRAGSKSLHPENPGCRKGKAKW